MSRLLDPGSIAIAGLSQDEAKHSRRVLSYLRRLGYQGRIWGVNPRLPAVDGIDMYPTVRELPEPPDVVVAAVPAAAAGNVVADSTGVGGVIVFAGGFAETGAKGARLQDDLAAAAARAGTRLLGPNSGGVIRPGRNLAASFLTCLERPPGQIRSGPVGIVTQSGGTGSYLHNLAADQSDGLAISVSTGNEADIRLAEAIEAVARLDEVRVVVAVIETVRDGGAFIEAVEACHSLGKKVVICRVGAGHRGASLMTSHTGALAVPQAVLTGVFDTLGVVVAETPAEAVEAASMMARVSAPGGSRVGIVTHSGGTALLLSDLAERAGLNLPPPSHALKNRVEPLLDHGFAANPLDMGGIIGGPARFAQVVDRFAGSGEYDVVVAVSTAHRPAHTEHRVSALLALQIEVPVLHLWMAGDPAADGLAALRRADAAVTEEPRAAVRALVGLTNDTAPPLESADPITGPFSEWGLPLAVGVVVATADEAAAAAEELGYPVVVKADVSGLAHKTESGGVRLDLRRPDEAHQAFRDVVQAASAAGWNASRARVQKYRPGLEMIVGGVVDPSFGPVVSVGMGGTLAEVVGDVVFAPAPLNERRARWMVDRLSHRAMLDGFRAAPPADVKDLARIVSVVSRGLVGSGLQEVEVNPLIWDGEEWVAVDWLVRVQ